MCIYPFARGQFWRQIYASVRNSGSAAKTPAPLRI